MSNLYVALRCLHRFEPVDHATVLVVSSVTSSLPAASAVRPSRSARFPIFPPGSTGTYDDTLESVDGLTDRPAKFQLSG